MELVSPWGKKGKKIVLFSVIPKIVVQIRVSLPGLLLTPLHSRVQCTASQPVIDQAPSALIHLQVKTQWEMGKVAKAFIFPLATYSVQVNDSCL